MTSPLRVGDRVRITSTPCGRDVGTRGRLTAVDMQSDYLEPFHVSTGDSRAVWASSVQRSRIQYPDAPGVHAALLLALAVLITAALVVLV
ncbi:hypothetical protein [Streptomyces sp. NPDC048603]|uniref:hypothetical protein n=1 Tax=Streptomyces sp. NPDC048603 TaxID=3365577 RepID=UPI00371E19E5